MLVNSVTSDRARRTGLILIILGFVGALVPFVGPSFDFGMGDTPAWTWTEGRATLHLAPGIAAMVGGLMLMRGRARDTQRLGAIVAAAGGTWFIIAPTLHPLWATPSMDMGGMSGMGDSALSSALSSLVYHYGTGVVIALLAAYALGSLAVARRSPEGRDAETVRSERGTKDSGLVEAHG